MRNQPWKRILLALAFIVAGPVGAAHALSSYLSAFSSTYPTAPAAIKNCTLCHPGGVFSQFTPYANDYAAAGHLFAPIEASDSDGDGFTNIAEINAGTFPGLATSKPAADTTPPTVSISSPVAAGTVKINAVNLSYAVSDGTVKVLVDGAVKKLVSGNVISGLANGPHTVRVESTDAASNVGSAEVSFTVDVEPMFAVSVADNNGNAVPEVAALLRDYATGGYAAYVKDASTKVQLRKIDFGATHLPKGLCAVADMNANGKQELAMLGKSATANAAIIKDSSTGAAVKTIAFPVTYEPVALAQVPDSNGNGSNELAMLGVSGTGSVAVVVKDIASGAVVKTVSFPSTLKPLALAVVADVSGNSAPELAVLSAGAGQAKVFLKDVVTGAVVKTLTYPATATALALAAVPDVNGNGADELAVIMASATGQSTSVLKDAFTGLAVKSLVASAKTVVPQGVVVAGDVNGNAASELGVLGLSAAGAVSVNLKDVSTGLASGAITFPARNMGATTEPPVNGQALYDTNCAGCHSVNGYDASGSPDLAAKGGLVAGKFATNHNGITLTAAEKTAMATFLNLYTAPAPPVSGQALYDTNCAGCHSVNGYDASGSPDLAAKGGLVASKLAAGHNGITLTAAQQTALATFLNQYTAPPTGGSCTSCHGQPPVGTTSPNRAGAHQVHSALAGVGTSCNVCHTSNPTHNGLIDRGISAVFNAKSGAATANTNQTCSNVSCHGGKVTPSWLTGTINVNTQCTSCHQSGTTQYNSYNSGQHSRHSGETCTACHSTTKLATGHFSNLATSTMEGPASATIGGAGTQVGAYNQSTGTCSSVACHGTETW